MVQESQLEMRALLLHLRPLGLKDKSLGEGIKDLVIDLQKESAYESHTRYSRFQGS